jgi:rare lipoprotein A
MKRICLLVFFLPLLAGCGHKQTTAKVPPPPNLPQQTEAPKPSANPPQQPNEAQPATIPTPQVANEKPLLTETGVASWYGPPYHNHRGSNGEVYDMNQMTAAHRTLPLNSVVRVTNIKTGHSAIVRITDRGPFIGERILDLSLAAAKAVDVWASGTAWVKMEVLETPVPIDSGGKWAVQIGAFNTVSAATQMKETLVNQYPSANVLEFGGPTGEWVRIRVQNDDRELAEQISRTITTPEGGVFLVRLD